MSTRFAAVFQTIPTNKYVLLMVSSANHWTSSQRNSANHWIQFQAIGPNHFAPLHVKSESHVRAVKVFSEIHVAMLRIHSKDPIEMYSSTLQTLPVTTSVKLPRLFHTPDINVIVKSWALVADVTVKFHIRVINPGFSSSKVSYTAHVVFPKYWGIFLQLKI